MTNVLFMRTGIRYDVAIDCIDTILSHWAEVTAREQGRPDPNPTVLARAENAKERLCRARADLPHDDLPAIEATIAKYAPIARGLNS